MGNIGTMKLPSNFMVRLKKMRQVEIAFLFQLQKKSATGHILKLAIGRSPVPEEH
jgi:hypothetical protein